VKLEIDLEKDSQEHLHLVRRILSTAVVFNSPYALKVDNTRVLLVNALMNLLTERTGKFVSRFDLIELFKKIGIDRKKAEVAIEDAIYRNIITEIRKGMIQLI
jgi:hypothetical protein